MLRQISALALCASISLFLTIPNAYSGVDHSAIEYERLDCIDRGGTFDHPNCIMPERDSDEQQSESSSGSGILAAIVVGVIAYGICRAAGKCGKKN